MSGEIDRYDGWMEIDRCDGWMDGDRSIVGWMEIDIDGWMEIDR